MTWFRKHRRSAKLQLSIHPEVRASFHADGLTLLHIPSGRVFVCNRTGARIWHGLSRGLNADSIADEISRAHGAQRDVVKEHTETFLGQLIRQRLVLNAPHK